MADALDGRSPATEVESAGDGFRAWPAGSHPRAHSPSEAACQLWLTRFRVDSDRTAVNVRSARVAGSGSHQRVPRLKPQLHTFAKRRATLLRGVPRNAARVVLSSPQAGRSHEIQASAEHGLACL